LTEEIMGAQNFNFAPKLHQNRKFSAPKFAILEESFLKKYFSLRKQFSGMLKFRQP